MLLVHGTGDDTVPFTSSVSFHDVSPSTLIRRRPSIRSSVTISSSNLHPTPQVIRSRGGAHAPRSLWARGRSHQYPVTAFMIEEGSDIERVVADFVHAHGGKGLVARM